MAVLGPNGAGKSMLRGSIAGLGEATGSVKFRGQTLPGGPLRAAGLPFPGTLRNSRLGEIGPDMTRPDPTTFRKGLEAGEIMSGASIKMPSGHMTEIFGDLGCYFVVIDKEHARFDRRAIDDAIVAAKASGVAALVRVAAMYMEDRTGRMRKLMQSWSN